MKDFINLFHEIVSISDMFLEVKNLSEISLNKTSIISKVLNDKICKIIKICRKNHLNENYSHFKVYYIYLTIIKMRLNLMKHILSKKVFTDNNINGIIENGKEKIDIYIEMIDSIMKI